ncbi:mitochondrial carrier [Cryphonectria parasitica EP155]|uniref:Mitochondrial thiamine pyrophosphate carrier 1 n=1 Tax=Cryphonectria parasitica (strain ATCC 38755 / EP155) TaxID=660469 RepID=A0A9P5CQJ9_CRYP1|nr:mitochondrial carrier [Cryphonectria parasitica EP155]KAF3767599.1 mitochondrial carrier [Cryphonectria parasitica EP155]
MPAALLENASMSALSQHEPRKDTDGRVGRLSKEDVTVLPAPDEAVASGKKVDKQSLDYLWRSGMAGGLAGCAGKTVVAPLDRVKILFQARNPQFIKYSGSWAGTITAMSEIYRQNGMLGLFRGHSATLLRVFPYAGIKFLAYEQIRSFVIPNKQHETPVRRALSGSLAGATSVFFTYPLEVIRVRLAFETKRDGRSSLSSICKQIYYEHPTLPPAGTQVQGPSAVRAASVAATPAVEAVAPKYGLINFYRGFSPTMLGMLPYAGISFLTHDTMGDLLRHHLIAEWTTLPQPKNAPEGKAAPLQFWAELFAGGVAGLVSQTSSYPLEVIRRRMQVAGAVGDGRRLRIAETAALIMKERGISGFFVGLTIGYVKVVPMAAVAFFTYERVKTVFGI